MTSSSTPMLEQIHSLPQLIRESLPTFVQQAEQVLPAGRCISIERFYLTGSGDSHHAALGAELAFHTLAGVPAQALSSLPFARYTVPFISEPEHCAVIGISVSGEVARTVEALHLSNQAGAHTFAVTGNRGSRLAHSAQSVLLATIPQATTQDPTPGVRSFVASLLMLYVTAIQVGEARGFLEAPAARAARQELQRVPEAIEATLDANETAIEQLVARWEDAVEFVFLGGGPNYGTASYCAAKLLEASGDPAIGQDVEEWTHLQYFASAVTTPTFFIDAAGRSHTRAQEAAIAARSIGRRVAAVVPASESAISSQAQAVLPVHGELREALSPLTFGLAGMLFADHRRQALDELYFRNFGGGRSAEGGGGISRIRTSAMQDRLET